MSDLSMYELEDIIWDDFDRGDDHIVPHPTNARTSKNSFEGDSCKRLRRETTPILSNIANLDATNTICKEKAERDSKPLDKKKNMMEKTSPSHSPPGVFNASCDGEIVKDMPDLASDDSRMSNNNSYSYPLTHISQTGDLCFVGNNCEDKESNDLLYYGWPDIGNFEDVDKMLRSCDSSFALGVTDNDSDLGWFTSDQIEGTEEALKMDFKFPCPEPTGLKNILADNDSSQSNIDKSSSISESKDEVNFKNQMNLQKKQSKHQNETEEKRGGQGVGNDDGSFYQISELTSNNSRLSSNNKSDQVFTSVGNRQQYRNIELDYFGHMQNNTSFLPQDYAHHQTTNVLMLSGIKSEHKGLKAPSPMGSSYASNQSSGDPSFEGTAATEVDGRKQSRNSQGFQPLFIGSQRQMNIMFQPSEGVLLSSEKQARVPPKELESQSDIERVQKGMDVPESSSISSELDEISLEATSFRQLQQVMEQLDLRTKLCIRDSLYRLARSAEQRHNNPGLSSSATDVSDLGGPLMAERTNKCTGFMDMETDTNPIDRSVAHLLFHRPSESPKLPPPLPPKPNLNHESLVVPSMMPEELVCQESAAKSNDKMGSGDGN